MSQRMKEFVGIQYLRGVAAMLVVVYHLGSPLERMGYQGHWPAGLSGGVDIFFVISGFVMWLTTRGRPTTTLDFWRRRITRIVPLYWLVTSVMLIVLLAAPQLMQTARFELGHVIASYLFIPAVNPARPAMEPLLFPGWTLNYEMFFYLIFGLLLPVSARARLIGTVAILAGLVALGVALDLPRLSIAGFYSDSIMLEFAFGMLLGELTFVRGGGRLLPRAAGWALMAAGFACLLLLPGIPGVPRSVLYGVPGVMIVLGCLSVECDGGVPAIPLLHHLGNASYSIYLTQMITMAAFFVAWRRLHLDAVPALMIPFCLLDVAVAAIGGLISYHLFEKSFVALFRPRPARKIALS
jgi:exopolysaccharide production protein ExoZ